MSSGKHSSHDDSGNLLSQSYFVWNYLASGSHAILDKVVQLHSTSDSSDGNSQTRAIKRLGNHRIRSLHWIRCDDRMDGVLLGCGSYHLPIQQVNQEQQVSFASPMASLHGSI